MEPTLTITANVVDILGRCIVKGEILIRGEQITSITPLGDSADTSLPYALPGFIDSHIHIESSMLVPAEFARLASVHGTVATVSDPHEIANVMGIAGIEFMIENGGNVPFKFCFGAPSCVPATAFETSGATIDADEIAELLQRPEIGYLAEMMNYPGVLGGDPQVRKKIAAARWLGKPIDGHSPGLTGQQAVAYIAAGINTDHECTTLAEALHKLAHGMKILIREGSAAKNFAALSSLIDSHPAEVMFCSDDKHPDELADGHINLLVKRAIADSADLFNVLRVACLNPIDHYSLPVGRLRPGDPADFILVNDLRDFQVEQTFVNGQSIARSGRTSIDPLPVRIINHFDCHTQHANDFRLRSSSGHSTTQVRVIQAIDGKLTTLERTALLPIKQGCIVSDVEQGVLKIAVINRYRPAAPAIAFISGFGFKCGAIASSVGHDSHNILAVGVDDESIVAAVNGIIENRGGIAAVVGKELHVLPLPIAGIISDRDGTWVANQYRRIDQFAKQRLGSTLSAPFMTLSFMALLVIPKLKLSDQGLFDGETFQFVPVELPRE